MNRWPQSEQHPPNGEQNTDSNARSLSSCLAVGGSYITVALAAAVGWMALLGYVALIVLRHPSRLRTARTNEFRQPPAWRASKPLSTLTRSQYRPSSLGPGDALQVFAPKVLNLEQIAEQFARTLGDNDHIRLGDALQAYR
jgi:hypothetical protein